MQKRNNPNGRILYRGPSLLDGKPIVAIVTGLAKRSDNGKTGDMLQTWILPDNGETPQANATSGRDDSVCGDCKHRPVNGGTCYVNLGYAPLAIADCLNHGSGYAMATDIAALGDGRKVRLGAYGDPAAVPVAIWQALVSRATNRTGYSHQWRNPAFAALSDLCMASVDTIAERAEAKLMGWRTFRVRPSTEGVATQPNEIACPASKEAGVKSSCDKCGLCKGASIMAKDIAIFVHAASDAKLERAIAA